MSLESSVITPFFLIGAERSGTTLLRLMLDHHPEVACLWESEYIVDYWPSDEVPGISEVAASIAANRNYRGYVESLGVRLPDSCDNLVHGFESFADDIRRKKRKRLVGATVHRHVDRLIRAWPSAKFIRLIRDGRDVANSRVAMGWEGNAWHAATAWLKEEKDWEAFRGFLTADQYIEVHFEALVSNPTVQLRQICGFLGISYSVAMLSYPDDTTYAPVDPAMAGQWRNTMTVRNLALVQSIQGEMLVRRGYALALVPSRSPGYWGKMWLRIHSRIVVLRASVTRLGLSLWAWNFWARRTGLVTEGRRAAIAAALADIVKRNLK